MCGGRAGACRAEAASSISNRRILPSPPTAAPMPPGLLVQAYGTQLAISCGLALAAATAVQLLAPRAAGGGVTWVMVRARM